MNRDRPDEERRRQNTIRKKYTPMDIKRFEKEQTIQTKIFDLARTLHIKKFPEEYDYQLDSISDTDDRRRGINPMNCLYAEEVNMKRAKQGVSPLSENGMPMSDDTWRIAYAEAERAVRGE